MYDHGKLIEVVDLTNALGVLNKELVFQIKGGASREDLLIISGKIKQVHKKRKVLRDEMNQF